VPSVKTKGKSLMSLSLMHKLTLILVLPIVFEFIFVGVLFSLLKLSDIDLARVEKAKETQSTCGEILFLVYQVGATAVNGCFQQDDSALAGFKVALAEQSELVKKLRSETGDNSPGATSKSSHLSGQGYSGARDLLPELTRKLRSECATNTDASHGAEMVTVLVTRFLHLLAKINAEPSAMTYMANASNFSYLSQRIIYELANISSMQTAITSHLYSRADWHTLIFAALSCGLLMGVAISLLVMLFVHADLLRRISVVTDNTTKVAEGSQLNRLVAGTDEIAKLDKFVHEMNEALVQAETQRREFMSMLTHDMRTPLTSVAILLDGLAGGEYEEDTQAIGEQAKTYLPEVERVNRMIDDLLTFEKLDAGKMRLIKAKFPVSELFREAVETLSIDAELKHVKLVERCDPNFTLVADKYQLKRVLINLCENAIKHTPKDGTVLLKATSSASDVVVEVIDEGPGLPDDSIDRIFEKYEQNVDPAAYKGFGLGLAICRAIIELHQGHIEARNRTDRSGAIFLFSLPTIVD
jgi:signal transduction histidine kinase